MFSKRSLSSSKSSNSTTEKQKQTNYYTLGALQLYCSIEIARQIAL